MERQVPSIRALYKAQRDAMLAALQREMPEGVRWNAPVGGMFLWVQLPKQLNATDLLPHAVARNVAYVPGAAFYSDQPEQHTLRLSFVSATAEQIHLGIAALARTIEAVLVK